MNCRSVSNNYNELNSNWLVREDHRHYDLLTTNLLQCFGGSSDDSLVSICFQKQSSESNFPFYSLGH